MPERDLKVLAICPFPAAFPSTRYRLLQYVEPLRELGIELEYRPFLNDEEHRLYFDDPRLLSRLTTIVKPIFRRIGDIVKAAKADVVFIQREAMPFGPGFFEWIFRVIARAPIVVDFDDAVYIPYTSGRYGKLGSFLKFYGKSNRLIRAAKTVVCGGQFLADHVESRGGKAVVIPTIVDKEIFEPSDRTSAIPVVGWIGTPSSYRYLKAIFPALERVAQDHKFSLRLRGTGDDQIEIDNVIIDNAPWNAETEVDDFRSLDIGLYPLVENEDQSLEFIQGKSGFKAIQYLALGIPYVVSPLGVTSSIGVAGETHFEAHTTDEWVETLSRLLEDVSLRRQMGKRGREHFEENYDLEKWVEVLAGVLRNAARGRPS